MPVLMTCWKFRDTETPAFLNIPSLNKGLAYIITRTADDNFSLVEAFNYHLNNKLPLHQKFFYATRDGSTLDAKGKMHFTFNYFASKRLILRFV